MDTEILELNPDTILVKGEDNARGLASITNNHLQKSINCNKMNSMEKQFLEEVYLAVKCFKNCDVYLRHQIIKLLQKSYKKASIRGFWEASEHLSNLVKNIESGNVDIKNL